MYEEVWNSGNLDVVEEICASDYRGIGPCGNEFGPQAVNRGVASRRAGFPDLHVTIEEMGAEGDKVAARLTFAGTHTGPFQRIEAMGKEVRWTPSVGQDWGEIKRGSPGSCVVYQCSVW